MAASYQGVIYRINIEVANFPDQLVLLPFIYSVLYLHSISKASPLLVFHSTLACPRRLDALEESNFEDRHGPPSDWV